MKTTRADIEKALNQYREQHEAAKKTLDDFYYESESGIISMDKVESFPGRILEQERQNLIELIKICIEFKIKMQEDQNDDSNK